jgi:DNA-binding MarR family transcriptional regulator
MESGGLIRKVKDLNRKNLVRIEVTEKGHALYLKTRGQESIDSVMSLLSEGEKKQLWSLLVKLRERAISELGWKDLAFYPPPDYPEIRD